jgi:hypothetical protein
VPAKRYLCATDPAYLTRLSAASVHTLSLQGGPMPPAEIAVFVAQSRWQDAILLGRSIVLPCYFSRHRGSKQFTVEVVVRARGKSAQQECCPGAT